MTTSWHLSFSRSRFCKFVVFCILTGAATLSVAEASDAHETRNIDPRNFRILGITLGDSTIQDIKRILGAAPERPSSEDTENSVICYASSGEDRTVLEFENWTEPIEFRLFRGSVKKVATCTPSPMVSGSVSTSSGLRLGMSRREVISVLGPPPKVGSNQFVYESPYIRSRLPKERKRASETHPKPKSVEVYDKIDIQFASSKVIRIDVVHSESW